MKPTIAITLLILLSACDRFDAVEHSYHVYVENDIPMPSYKRIEKVTSQTACTDRVNQIGMQPRGWRTYDNERVTCVMVGTDKIGRTCSTVISSTLYTAGEHFLGMSLWAVGSPIKEMSGCPEKLVGGQS